MVKIVPFHNTPKIIWLDTNIINDITDAITNKRIDADIKSRSLLLYFKLQKLVNEEKIISPFLNQRDEYINTSVYELSDSILMALGKGKQLQTYLTEYIQIKRMIKIYIENSNQFYLDKQDIPYYFEEEDKKDNKFRDNLGFKRTILQTGANKEGIDRENEKFFDFLKRRKEELSKHNKKFDEVLHEELLSRKNLFESTIKQIKEEYGYIKTDFDYLTFYYCNIYPLIAWREITGKVDVDAVSNFLESDYFFNIPCEEIHCKLGAKILTDSFRNIDSGDYGDITNLSIILPYASLVITDKSMKGNIQQLKLDKKYDTKVFSLNDFDDIMIELEKVG